MTDYLMFTLCGAMASWGDTAVGETRPSYAYPTKSAVIGLCAAALGVERDNLDLLSQLSQSFDFAVCVEREGDFMMDYHTTQVPSATKLKKKPHQSRRDELVVDELKTILSTRDYYCDALYTVVLWALPHKTIDITLEDFLAALKRPKFVLYLGRKSCPLILPSFPRILSDEGVDLALKNYFGCAERKKLFDELFFQKNKQGLNRRLRLYADASVALSPGLQPSQWQVRKDKLLHRKAWQYSDRAEHLYYLVAEELGL